MPRGGAITHWMAWRRPEHQCAMTPTTRACTVHTRAMFTLQPAYLFFTPPGRSGQPTIGCTLALMLGTLPMDPPPSLSVAAPSRSEGCAVAGSELCTRYITNRRNVGPPTVLPHAAGGRRRGGRGSEGWAGSCAPLERSKNPEPC